MITRNLTYPNNQSKDGEADFVVLWNSSMSGQAEELLPVPVSHMDWYGILDIEALSNDCCQPTKNYFVCREDFFLIVRVGGFVRDLNR